MNPDNMQAQLITRLLAPIVFSAISTALSSALAAAVFAQPTFTNAKEIKAQTPKDNELLTGQDIKSIFQDLINRYNSVKQNYNDFKIESDISKSEMLYFAGSKLSSNDPFGNTPLTRLVANQRFGLVKAIMNEVGDQELLKAHPDLTKRFLDSCDNKGINFLEMSSRFYGVMPEGLLKKVVSLYAENAEPESIKLTPAILSLPEDLFHKLLTKIDKTNMEEFTNPNVPEKKIYDGIVKSREEVGLSPLVIYVATEYSGLEYSVLANYKPENDFLPDQSGWGKVTSDPNFLYREARSGTLVSERLAQQDEEIIMEKIDRPDLNKVELEALTNALLKRNPPSIKMAEENAVVNIRNLLQLDVCPSTKPNSMEAQPMRSNKILQNEGRP